MFDKAATYHKTTAGAEAIATRSSALTARLRSMLILIDGKRSCDELAKMGDVELLLPQLAELGFIAPVAGTARVPAAPAAASALAGTADSDYPPSRPASVVSLAEAKRFAVRRLNDLLGPASDDLCIRIEGTRTPQEFLAAVQRAESLLRQFGGSQMAAKFSADMESHRPA